MPVNANKRRSRAIISKRNSILAHAGWAYVEALESRRLLSTSVSTFHNDITANGVNSNETELTPASVKLGSFGKLYTTPLDGAVYTEPLIQPQVTITSGPNTSAGSTGVHDVAIVATENDSVYAIDAGRDAGQGTILWKRSFLNLTAGQIGTAVGTDINNTLGSSVISTVTDTQVNSDDISPEMGITGTPVIDSSTGIIYLVTFASETIGGATHYVQMLHAINISDGTDVAQPYLLGDTSNGNTNNTAIYVYGTGDGSVKDPYNNTGKNVVQFNALRENQRAALSLVNGTLYISWASHGDQSPYHGWVVTLNANNILTTGFALTGVLNTSPNSGECGIWMGGGALSFETDGSAFYLTTGNGHVGDGDQKLNSAGFPSNGSYPDAVIKAELDPTTSPTEQGENGWGIKIVDYFIPYNQSALDNADEDFGSGQTLILPASAGIPGHANLLIAAGKEGTIYLLDRDNLGHHSPNGDAALNAVPDGTGQNTPPVLMSGALSAPSYFDGKIYWNTGYDGPVKEFTINSNGTISSAGSTPETSMGYLPSSVSISSDGSSNAIVWATDLNTNELHAYDATNLSTELWNSGQASGGADSTGTLAKFSTPSIANGEVFLGTSNSLVAYGLTSPQTTAPMAPVLSGAPLSSSSVHLSWTDPSTSPNIASGYLIKELISGTYEQVATAAAGATSIDISGLSALTTYSFLIDGYNGLGDSEDSNIVTVTTTKTVTGLNFSAGFAGSTTQLTYNGAAKINGNDAELTSNGTDQASSVFSDNAFNVAQFTTSFDFKIASGSSADGFTFTLQGTSPSALGAFGGGLGFGTDGQAGGATIGKSVAIKFDLYSNAGEGPDSTGIYENGASPTVPSINLSSTGINLHTPDIFAVTMSYQGTNLVVSITDTATSASATQTYPINISSYTGSQAYVGFTAGTGQLSSTINILNWGFSPSPLQAPAAPTGLSGTPASGTSVSLSWTNNANNQTGYLLDRATDSAFTQNLVTLTLPAAPSAYTDSTAGIAPGGTYYYRIRSTNSAGNSTYAYSAPVTIPTAPAPATDPAVTNVTASEIDLSWMDNAGKTAVGYHILRSTNNGAFSLYASLPALNGSDQEGGGESPIYTWSDSGVEPGTSYQYRIQAYNISGNIGYIQTGATTLTVAPTLTAAAENNAVKLSWSAPAGAVAYNLYRGTAAGAETLLASNISTASYTDNTAANGKTYYYYVTALNGNATPLPQESAHSQEVSSTPSATASQGLNFSSGFANSASQLTYNGSAAVKGADAQLTNGSSYEAGSVFSTSALNVTQFTTAFEFQLSSGTSTADGFTFTIQGSGANALGGKGGGLGYGAISGSGSPTIGKSVAIKFDLYSNAGEGPDSTGLYENGATPTNANSINLSSTGINLHSGDIFAVTMSYNGTSLAVVLTDTKTKKSATQTYKVNIASLAGPTAYVGFTGGSGLLTATQNILNWTFTPGA